MSGRPSWNTEPHGTAARYQRHRRHGEQACAACLQAEAVRVAMRKKAARANAEALRRTA